MLPFANQIQSRAGPGPVQPTRSIDAVQPMQASARQDIPPVVQADAAADTFQRGRDDIDRAQDAQSAAELRRLARTGQDAAADADSPQDRAVFRAKVIRFLQSIYHDDTAFQRALKHGTIVIRAVEDMPEPDMRPEIAYAIYRQGAMQAGQTVIDPGPARLRPPGQAAIGASDFVAWWPK
mgnify:CR=1 FL=1|jgi:hypothetical protein